MNEILYKQAEEILSEEDKIAALCNLTALLYQEVPNINWVGYYFYRKGKLVLGPFQGKVACTKIDVGKGVCGSSFASKLLLNVADVHEFPGHIACDSASNSELVVPLLVNNECVGVLDIDSPLFNRFELEDEELFLAIAKLISRKIAG